MKTKSANQKYMPNSNDANMSMEDKLMRLFMLFTMIAVWSMHFYILEMLNIQRDTVKILRIIESHQIQLTEIR